MANHDDTRTAGRYSRGTFLTRLGLGAGAVATSGGLGGALAPPVQAAPARSRFVSTDAHFGRIFPSLPPFAAPSLGVKKNLLALGAKDGLLDAKDPLSAGPSALITDPALSANNPDNPTHTAGTTFMGSSSTTTSPSTRARRSARRPTR